MQILILILQSVSQSYRIVRMSSEDLEYVFVICNKRCLDSLNILYSTKERQSYRFETTNDKQMKDF